MFPHIELLNKMIALSQLKVTIFKLSLNLLLSNQQFDQFHIVCEFVTSACSLNQSKPLTLGRICNN